MSDTLHGSTTRNRQLPRAQRRAQILRAAARAFSDAGFAVTSMESVAAEAGITKLIVYRHFESKEELYRAVLDQMVEELRRCTVDAVAVSGGRLPPMSALLTAARANPDAYKLLVWHAPREPRFESVVRGYWEDSVALLDTRIGAEFPDPALRPWIVRRLWLYALDSVLLWVQTGSAEHDERFLHTATAGLLALCDTWAVGDTAPGGEACAGVGEAATGPVDG